MRRSRSSEVRRSSFPKRANSSPPQKSNKENGIGASEQELPSHRRSTVALTQDKLINSPIYKQCAMHPYNPGAAMPLYRIDQVPEYLRDNQYILASYRAYYSTPKCLQSLFYLHNETFNIWTHLLGGVLFIYLSVQLFSAVLLPRYRHQGNVVLVSAANEKSVHVEGERQLLPLLIFGFYSFSCLMCMVCSACFHMLIAHISERLYSWAHALDYFGITFLVVGSFIPFCYYCFACEPTWRKTYLTMICSFGVVGFLGPLFRRWTSRAFATKKIAFYVCMVSSGLLPIGHIAYLNRAGQHLPYIHGLLRMMFLYGLGVFIYAFKIPEIFLPGRFDVFCSSHQIWHLCVLGAALTHFYNSVDMYMNVDKLRC